MVRIQAEQRDHRSERAVGSAGSVPRRANLWLGVEGMPENGGLTNFFKKKEVVFGSRGQESVCVCFDSSCWVWLPAKPNRANRNVSGWPKTALGFEGSFFHQTR